ncbi:MAG: hypothetical protein CVV30_00870 [Methanomicrobiales archaeon HGW-Methanomicrobiales-1]|jgi:hypothetical protein|nr:MAG: hypothetical protein CVV30_00870 [Methanomicrobiales archaeon HGW-Methanomicrobiales-1]
MNGFAEENGFTETNQESQENTPIAEKMDAAVTAAPARAIELDGMPVGTDDAGRDRTGPGETGPKESPRRSSVKGKKRRKGQWHKKNAGGVAAKGKKNGQHVPRGSCEIAALLEEEGYIVGVIPDPKSPFDLIGWSNAGSILIRVTRPIELVANARNVREQYEEIVREMEPYYRTEADNIQFMVISRAHGLLRYRVWDWGIGNVVTMQKIMKTPHASPSDQQITTSGPANRRARNSPCPVEPAGLVIAPDAPPVHTAIPL